MFNIRSMFHVHSTFCIHSMSRLDLSYLTHMCPYDIIRLPIDEQQQGEILTSEVCVSVKRSGESCNGR
jgi:hypothetical protein